MKITCPLRIGEDGNLVSVPVIPQNRCWFAARMVAVRRKYGLTIDWRQADALKCVLSACDSTEMVE